MAKNANDPMRVCFVQPNESAPSETFIHAQAERLPVPTTVLFGKRPFRTPCRAADTMRYLRIRLRRVLTRQNKQWEYTQHSVELFREIRPDVVVAQFGPTGVRVMDACRLSGIPLIVNFRGADASIHQLIDEYSVAYRTLFKQAAAIVAVSHSIERTLLSLGAPREKLHWNPSGADCDRFHGGDPAAAPPVFLGTGRFVEKKAPHLLIFAFAEVHRRCPNAQLRIIGEGPLLPFCRDLVRHLRLDKAVEFLGVQPHERVQLEMKRSRGFAQHSIVAASGDSEGTPVAVMEASASCLPVVATHHAGIPDVVVDGETGFLVDEGDVFAMASGMLKLVEDPLLAQRMGRAGRARVEKQFSQRISLERIWAIIQQCHTSGSRAEDAEMILQSEAA